MAGTALTSFTGSLTCGRYMAQLGQSERISVSWKVAVSGSTSETDKVRPSPSSVVPRSDLKAPCWKRYPEYPDSTIEDEISGRNIYWEHLGMLERDEYRLAWERKLASYSSHGILPAAGGGGSRACWSLRPSAASRALTPRPSGRSFATITIHDARSRSLLPRSPLNPIPKFAL